MVNGPCGPKYWALTQCENTQQVDQNTVKTGLAHMPVQLKKNKDRYPIQLVVRLG